MRPNRHHALIITMVALLGSALAHLLAYGELGVLWASWQAREAAARNRAPASETSFFELVAVPEVPVPAADETTPPEEETQAAVQPRHAREPRPNVPPPPPPPETPPPVTPPVPTPVVQITPPAPAQPVVPPQPPPNRAAVMQHSEHPNDPPPDNARFVADENNHVEEETVARITNHQEDQENPQLGAQQAPPQTPTNEEGDSAEDRVADVRDVRGSDARAATPEETHRPEPRRPTDATPAASRLPNDTRRGGENGAERGASVASGDTRTTPRGEARASAADRAAATETITVTDAAGTFVVTRPRTGGGAGAANARERSARSRGTPGEDPLRRGTASGSGETGPNLRMGFSQFEQVMGEETLRDERDARFAEQRSGRAGHSRAERWQEFRAAIENFQPSVRPGNQTALNAAASPGASFLVLAHNRIHREFAERFIPSLGTYTGPATNQDLRTTLEIVLNPDGTVYRVGVVHTSGVIIFDHGAYSSVMNAQPYPVPPQSIRSGDGRVYLHWQFLRNEMQCHHSQAQIFMIPNPPDLPPTTTSGRADPTRTPTNASIAVGGARP